MSHTPRWAYGSSGDPARTAMVLPSGEISGPPIVAWLWTTRPRPAVRLTAGPPPTNWTQTSVRPPSEARYATNFPSGEIAGLASRLVPGVSAEHHRLGNLGGGRSQ